MGILTTAAQALGLSEAPTADGTGDYSPQITPPTWGGTTRAEARFATIPAVYRSIQLIAGMAGQLTLNAWRGNTLLETPAILAQPDPWRPLSSWIQRVVISLATEGNAFIRKTYGPDNRVVSLEVLNPHKVEVIHRNGIKSYTYGAETLTTAEVRHVWHFEMPGLTRSLSPIGQCRAAVEGIQAVTDYAQAWFTSGDAVNGVLTTDQRLNPEDVDRYREVWYKTPTAGPTTGPRLRVLGQGLSYAHLALNPEEAQWLESQRAGVLEIARMFGLPAEYLLVGVEGSNLTYRTLETIDAGFLRLTLFPNYLTKIEDVLSDVLPRGQVAKFDPSGLLRPDAKTRADINKLYLDAGVKTVEEVRVEEGLDPTIRPLKEKAPA
jgi:HK97 family phage portal protein